MSRVKKQLKNFKVNTLIYLLSIGIYFYSRKIFLEYLGDDFVGLTGTLKGFLGFLNLAELGIGTAIGFFLYKPLFKKNYDFINRIFKLFGFLYKKIGLFVLIAGIILSLFFPLIFKEAKIELTVIYFAFFSILSSALMGYFYNYHLFILQADQKNYIVNQYFQTVNICKVIIQVIIVYYTQNYYLWIALEVIFMVIYSILLKKKTKKEYPWLLFSNKADNSIFKEFPDVIKKVKQISIHKFSTVVTTGTDDLLIFAFVSLQSVAFFNNYKLITNSFSALLNTALSSIGSGVGNLVAENNEKQINKVFWEIVALNFFVGGFIFQILFFFIEKFIRIWLEDEKYILSDAILICLLLVFFIGQIRKPIDNFIQAYGLYADTWAPITQSIVNLLVSIVLAKFYGILGILLGTIISSLIIIFGWKSFYLFNSGFKKSTIDFWKGYGLHSFIFLISFFLSKNIIDNIQFSEVNTYLSLFKYSVIIGTITTSIYAVLIYIFSKGFRGIFKRVINMATGFIQKKINK